VGDSASGARVTVTSDRDGLDEKPICFAEDAGSAQLTIERKGGWLAGFFDGGWFRGHHTRIEVNVPYATTVELSPRAAASTSRGRRRRA
jgi:hypothetical protein